MVTNLARVRTVMTGLPGTPAYSNFYFDAGTGDAGVYQSLVLDFWTALAGQIRMTLTMSMVNPIPIINDTTGEVVDVAVGDGGSVNSTGNTDELPPMTSGLLQMHTGVFYNSRELRGRCFIPYPLETSSTDGKPTSTYTDLIQATAEDLLGSEGANGAWRVWSRTKLVSNAVSSVAVWNQWASLRSRRD